ncbi:MAG: dTMP kinase [Hyphomicrobiales bacterium]|nr:dTMP kinase [Hyphomicrobiales bacterium]MCO5086005.1 dTMP kinase [Methylobacteriaceae bacterium]
MHIVLSGIDGSGKSTQAQLLFEALRKRGQKAILTREPGATDFGLAIRRLLLTDARKHNSPETDFFLFMADRAEHLAAVVRPALAEGAWVIQDRGPESTLAYQGPQLGVDGRFKIARLHHAMGWPVPDVTIVYDLSPKIAHQRLTARTTEESDPDLSRLEHLRAVYLDRAQTGLLTKARVVVEATRSIEALAETTMNIVGRVHELKQLAATGPRIMATAVDRNGGRLPFDATEHLLLSTYGRLVRLTDLDSVVSFLQWAETAPPAVRAAPHDFEVEAAAFQYRVMLTEQQRALLSV